jgi:hypothetical protein
MAAINIKKEFKKVRAFLTDIPNINCGGCGIAALAMYRWLKRKKACDVRFIVGYNNANQFKINSEYVVDHSNNSPVAPCHIGLAIRFDCFDSGVIMDCEKDWELFRWRYIHMFEDESAILDMINKGNNWNDSFDRSDVLLIAERLNIDLTDVKI